VLFVSHNMASVQSLCTNGILLNQGGIHYSGNINNTITRYLNQNSFIGNEIPIKDRKDRRGQGGIMFSNIELYSDQQKVNALITGKSCTFRISYELLKKDRYKNCRIGLACSKQSVNFFLLSTELVCNSTINIETNGFFEFNIPEFPLSIGIYSITLFIESQGEIQDWITEAITLHVEDGNFYGTGRSYAQGWEGKSMLLKHSFELFDK